MKYLALSLLFLLPAVSFAATVDEQKTAIIQQLIVLIEQELDYLMSIQAGTPTGAAVDNTVAIQSLTQQLNTPTMQPDIIVHDDTAWARSQDNGYVAGKPNARYYNVFVQDAEGYVLKPNDPTATVVFSENGKVLKTAFLNGKVQFDPSESMSTPNPQPGVFFSHDFATLPTDLTIESQGLTKVIHIDN